MTIIPAFLKFPKEAVLIGRLLAGYGEMELTLCNCVAMAIDDLDMVLKAMFRARGETQRIDIADALGRRTYRDLKLETQFSEAVAGMRYCLKIRNQFAHCQFHDDLSGRGLGFVDMEEIATEHAFIKDLAGLTVHFLDVPLLQKQEEYFVHVTRCLQYVNFEGRYRAGKLKASGRVYAVQPKVTRPPLYTP